MPGFSFPSTVPKLPQHGLPHIFTQLEHTYVQVRAEKNIHQFSYLASSPPSFFPTLSMHYRYDAQIPIPQMTGWSFNIIHSTHFPFINTIFLQILSHPVA